jgi:hypothetical protein
VIEGNEIIYCAVGVGIPTCRPSSPTRKIGFRNNRIAYNGIGICSPASWAATSSPTTSSRAT